VFDWSKNQKSKEESQMRTKARHYYPPIKKCRGSTLTTLEEAEIIPDKHSDSETRIKPLPLTNGHGHYM
jgi:hypothetical protein